MTSSIFLDSFKFNELLKETNKRIEFLLTNVKQPLTQDGKVLPEKSLHLLLQLMEPRNQHEKMLYEVIFNAVLKAEGYSAGAGYLCLVLFNQMLSEFLRGRKTSLQEIFEFYDQKILNEPIVSFLKNEKEIEELCLQLTDQNKELTRLVTQAVELAGLQGSIHVEKGEGLNHLVELGSGYNFDIEQLGLFSLTKTWHEKNVKVMIVEGVIESVSEIETILMKSIETKIPLLVVCQGYSEEVIGTLKVNYDRKLFNIFPIKTLPDLNGINVLNDIAAACGVKNVTSSLKGELVSTIKYEDLPLVDEIRIHNKILSVENPKSKFDVNEQLRFLIQKRNEVQHSVTVYDLDSLYNKRIQSLLSHNVSIKLRKLSPAEEAYYKSKIDVTLRTLKSVLSHGTVSLVGPLEERIKSSVGTVPRLTAWSALHFSKKVLESLGSVGGAVVINDEE